MKHPSGLPSPHEITTIRNSGPHHLYIPPGPNEQSTFIFTWCNFSPGVSNVCFIGLTFTEAKIVFFIFLSSIWLNTSGPHQKSIYTIYLWTLPHFHGIWWIISPSLALQNAAHCHFISKLWGFVLLDSKIGNVTPLFEKDRKSWGSQLHIRPIKTSYWKCCQRCNDLIHDRQCAFVMNKSSLNNSVLFWGGHWHGD